MEHTQAEVGDNDAFNTRPIGAKQFVETQPTLIFLEDQMQLFQRYLDRR